jgi:hypothetical protein
MEPSKNVLAVMGLLCISRNFREEFFANPRSVTQSFVREVMSEDELDQIDAIAGRGSLPHGMSYEQFVAGASDAFDNLYTFYLCPMRPCPGPDPFAASS